MLKVTEITFCGQAAVMACDQLCDKAWGTNNRPTHYFLSEEEDPDDHEYLADQELGEAPSDPGTYEGGHGKPTCEEEKHNKWCCRECERCEMVRPGEAFNLSDFTKRVPNRSDREPTPIGE